MSVWQVDGFRMSMRRRKLGRQERCGRRMTGLGTPLKQLSSFLFKESLSVSTHQASHQDISDARQICVSG